MSDTQFLFPIVFGAICLAGTIGFTFGAWWRSPLEERDIDTRRRLACWEREIIRQRDALRIRK